MGLGAIFAALNTMYSAVSVRTREIATLRAIGFGAGGVIVSVLAEALLLALIGAGLGAAIAWLLFNGNTVTLGDSARVDRVQDAGDARVAASRRAARVLGRLHRRAAAGGACGAASSGDGAAGRLDRQRAAALVAVPCSCCASSSICSIASGAPCSSVRFKNHGPTNGGSQKSGSISMR